jgi:signal transduction histidine kinase
LLDEPAVRAIVVNHRDVTQQRALEDELRRQGERLTEADRHKDEFLAILAHELRNALAPASIALQVMRVAGDGAAVGEARELVERQVQQMTRLVDDLLDISRVASGKIDLRREPVEIAAILERAVEMSRPLVEAAGQRLTVAGPSERLWLEADTARLVQVLSNLLNNAAKFTERGGQIWLTAEREGGDVLLRVRDTGAGISAEALPRLFDLFSQAERTLERSQGGLGIGLSVVKRLVELHGGSVAAHSDGPGRGSTFVVRLPLLPQAPEGAPSKLAPPW